MQKQKLPQRHKSVSKDVYMHARLSRNSNYKQKIITKKKQSNNQRKKKKLINKNNVKDNYICV